MQPTSLLQQHGLSFRCGYPQLGPIAGGFYNSMDSVLGVVIRNRAQSLEARNVTQRLTAGEEAKALMESLPAVALPTVP